ncbi:GNAT family N-acetyltransferase [Actinosynnema sp. NPDC059335]|uniref:GNAT family N-acetyltransferase n=1 Tax=Actinosynnema sp. NPDC059335 TaxID=3346804 RepID=UPI003672D0E3
MTTRSPATDADLTDLVRRWERGWRACRGWEPPREEREALHLLPRRPGRHREIVALRPDHLPGLRALAGEAAGDRDPTWLTVPTTRPDEVEPVLRDAGLHVKATREWLMTRALATHPPRTAPSPYRARTTTSGTGLLTVEVWHGHGSDAPAARGQAAVGRGDAVFDRIETAPAHRRRGLGSVVMATLAEGAVDLGARDGVLVASPDGRALYASLGWTTRAAVVIATNGAG